MTEERIRQLGEMRLKVLERYPDADPDTVWHTLVNLDEPPIERLERVLRLGRFSFFRKCAPLLRRTEEA